jgi:hypothetical protein
MLEQLMPELIEIGVGLVSLLGTVLLAVLSKYVWAKMRASDMELLGSAADYLDRVVSAVVIEAEQTVASELRQKLADGKITEAEFKQSMRLLRMRVLAKLKDVALGSLLKSGHSEAQALRLLEAKLEEKVPRAKAYVAAGQTAVKK